MNKTVATWCEGIKIRSYLSKWGNIVKANLIEFLYNSINKNSKLNFGIQIFGGNIYKLYLAVALTKSFSKYCNLQLFFVIIQLKIIS